jgi:hypothetical protein
MSFARQWPSGIADNDPATGAKLTQLDLNVSRALDGYAGGNSSPSTPIGLGGAGLKMNLGGKLNLSGAKAPSALMNWFPAVQVIGGSRVFDACSPEPGNIIAATENTDTIYQSLDDGNSWADITSHITVPASVALQCIWSDYVENGVTTNSEILVAGVSANLYRSVNGGTSFANVTFPGTPTTISVLSRAADGTSYHLAGGKKAGAPYMAYAGVTNSWTQATLPGSITGSNACISIAHMPVSGIVVASFDGSQTKLAVSTDGGATWAASATSLTAGTYSVAYCDGCFLASSTAGDFYTSTDGSTWTTVGLATIATPWTRTLSLNGMMIGVSDTHLVFSLDNGVTLFPMQKKHSSRTRTGAVVLDGRLWYFAFSANGYAERSQKLGNGSLSI